MSKIDYFDKKPNDLFFKIQEEQIEIEDDFYKENDLNQVINDDEFQNENDFQLKNNQDDGQFIEVKSQKQPKKLNLKDQMRNTQNTFNRERLLKSSKDHFTKNANNFKPFQEERDGLNRLLTTQSLKQSRQNYSLKQIINFNIKQEIKKEGNKFKIEVSNKKSVTAKLLQNMEIYPMQEINMGELPIQFQNQKVKRDFMSAHQKVDDQIEKPLDFSKFVSIQSVINIEPTTRPTTTQTKESQMFKSQSRNEIYEKMIEKQASQIPNIGHYKSKLDFVKPKIIQNVQLKGKQKEFHKESLYTQQDHLDLLQIHKDFYCRPASTLAFSKQLNRNATSSIFNPKEKYPTGINSEQYRTQKNFNRYKEEDCRAKFNQYLLTQYPQAPDPNSLKLKIKMDRLHLNEEQITIKQNKIRSRYGVDYSKHLERLQKFVI